MIAAAFPTATVSLVYMLWDACRRSPGRATRFPRADEPPTDEEKLGHRLDRLTLVVKPLPGRRG
jgi:hypothetical protein